MRRRSKGKLGIGALLESVYLKCSSSWVVQWLKSLPGCSCGTLCAMQLNSANMDMLEQLKHMLKEQESNLTNFKDLFTEITIASKTILIKEGDISQKIYFVKNGCLRAWFNNQGVDVTFQFFFENQGVSGFFGREPCLYTLESIEPSTIITLQKKDFENLLKEIPGLKDEFLDLVMQRLENYSKLFLSRIKDNPQKRYDELIKDNPQIFQRVSQHYIASYLGITPVSLSRIRNRKK